MVFRGAEFDSDVYFTTKFLLYWFLAIKLWIQIDFFDKVDQNLLEKAIILFILHKNEHNHWIQCPEKPRSFVKFKDKNYFQPSKQLISVFTGGQCNRWNMLHNSDIWNFRVRWKFSNRFRTLLKIIWNFMWILRSVAFVR